MIEFPSCPQWYLERRTAQKSCAMNTLSSVGFSQESQSYVFVMAEGVLRGTHLLFALFDFLCWAMFKKMQKGMTSPQLLNGCSIYLRINIQSNDHNANEQKWKTFIMLHLAYGRYKKRLCCRRRIQFLKGRLFWQTSSGISCNLSRFWDIGLPWPQYNDGECDFVCSAYSFEKCHFNKSTAMALSLRGSVWVDIGKSACVQWCLDVCTEHVHKGVCVCVCVCVLWLLMEGGRGTVSRYWVSRYPR